MTNLSKLDRAIDKAIAEENTRYLADTAQQEADRRLGELYRRVCEALDRGFVQKPYPQETLLQFVERAGC